MIHPDSWAERLKDDRSRRVVFLSHCLLNENTRYLGGACRAGAVREVVQPCLDHGVGIVQMPCPEQHAWGGVLKTRLLPFYGGEGTWRHRLRGLLLPLMLGYTRRVYRRLARTVAEQVVDYARSGFVVIGIVGVDGSPSCGVTRCLDVAQGLDGLAHLRADATVADANAVVRAAVMPGRGLFVALLQEELGRRGLRVPFSAHDLLAELDGARSPVAVEPLLGRHPPPPTPAVPSSP
jgi:uncharacterized protein YbbK (DUF523 family)